MLLIGKPSKWAMASIAMLVYQRITMILYQRITSARFRRPGFGLGLHPDPRVAPYRIQRLLVGEICRGHPELGGPKWGQQSMDWFKGKFAGKSHISYRKITLVSGEDFP